MFVYVLVYLCDKKIGKFQYSIYNSMNFCQKHQNHHCIHAHDCKNIQHKLKKSKTPNKTKRQPNNDKYLNKLAKIIEEKDDGQSKCNFEHECNSNNCHKIIQKLQDDLNKQYQKNQQITKLNSENNRKYDKINDENKHLIGQIEYYRSQLDRIAKTSQQDMNQQIKNNIKQNTEQMGKINQMMLQINKKNEEKKRTQQHLTTILKEKQILSTQLQDLQKHHKDVKEKLKKVINDNQQLNKKSQKLQKQNKMVEEKYKNLAEQTKNMTKKDKKSHQTYQIQIEKYRKMLATSETERKQQKDMYKLQLKNYQENEDKLKQKLQKLSKNNEQLKQQNSELKKDIECLQQEFKYTKNLLKKTLELNDKNKSLQHFADKLDDKSLPDQTRHHSPKKKKVSWNEENIQPKSTINLDRDRHTKISQSPSKRELQKQIESLKQKNKKLELQINIKNNDQNPQYISAADKLKKIIDQKNETIKRLMREKSQIANQLANIPNYG